MNRSAMKPSRLVVHLAGTTLGIAALVLLSSAGLPDRVDETTGTPTQEP